ncbi:hypothetical protein COW94_03005 [Candidatus Peregrinibacteria bacterium CG22_combo_CG10-13_8_21_14_all_44_10]|nr:MAG: hypothetical protein AUK45_04460 [Candidatus Peregrinibacteria bacterium CG2_30_44_17]PIP66209.1 MAG: hypothetical protein COW94_03005 [Candidatus Peregrinibacteria bacterium CG22_combo_CG10-13_8_21_14_all_44_10]PIS04369.1 MAG: hypothetical protein COT83_00950 [Candidatus Peregrinibacteria bacterium CG10_big_fil_rev_8_21_14_0_10_44_7]PIX79503.1 MAG: hypothetical protein COZ35_03350 [Candidatus Peregrinibacteria bacterium CG_4_10_14_3_um_filter_44_21]PJB88576.1 MAG: hypothetical protein 
MATYILVLAHLAGDFLFQPGKLVGWKQKSPVGVLVHVLIIVSINLLLFLPYLGQALVWWAILILGVTHFIQDCAKVFYEKKYNHAHKAYPFFVDQFMHLLIIFIIGKYLIYHLKPAHLESDFLSKMYFNENLYVYGALLILFSYALDIVIYQVQRHRNPKLKYRRHYDAMSKRVFAFAVVYAVFLGIGLIFN